MQDDWQNEATPEEKRWLEELLFEARRPSLFAGNTFYWMTCVAFELLQAGMAPLFWLLSGTFAISVVGYTTSLQALFYLGVLLLPVVIYLLTHPGVSGSFRLNPVSPGRTLVCVAAAGAGFLAANFVTTLWMLLLEALGANAAATSGALSGSLMLDIFVVAVLPGICEELLFRGMLLATYERWGTWKAIWISALLFTGLHGSVVGIPAELMLGVTLGYVAVSTNSLYACMMLHTTYNAATLIASYAAPESEVAAVGTMLEQLGGMSGVIAVALVAIAFMLALFFCLRLLDVLRRRDGMRFGNDRVIEMKKLSRSEVVLLASSLCTLAWFYVQDLWVLFGGGL